METIHFVRTPKVEYGRLPPLLTDFLSRNLDAGIPLRFIPAYGGLLLEGVFKLLKAVEHKTGHGKE